MTDHDRETLRDNLRDHLRVLDLEDGTLHDGWVCPDDHVSEDCLPNERCPVLVVGDYGNFICDKPVDRRLVFEDCTTWEPLMRALKNWQTRFQGGIWQIQPSFLRGPAFWAACIWHGWHLRFDEDPAVALASAFDLALAQAIANQKRGVPS